MYDSYGDGWNGATYTITSTVTGDIIGSGDLDSATNGDGSTYGENYFSINTESCGFGCMDETAQCCLELKLMCSQLLADVPVAHGYQRGDQLRCVCPDLG